MTLPESFTIFSPSFSIFKTLTAAEYLARTESLLESLPKWKEVSAVTSIFALTVLLLSTAVGIVLDDESKSTDEQSKASQFFSICTGLSAVTLAISGLTLLSIPYIVQPILTSRVEWLQAGLELTSNN